MPEPPRTGDAVLELVRKSELVDPDALAGFLSRSGPLPPTAADTATRLVQDGLLTAFQARLLLQGKHRGFRIGQYKILDQIGVGGMGQVFLAEHTMMHRRVALKVLPARLTADKVAVERFYREARAVAALDHPNIVRAHDVACDKGTHYLVLEYVEGRNLEQRLKEAGGKLPWGEAAGYVVQAAAGLKHAHDKGLVHRDIKPANLLVDRDGVVKVLDLGLARFFENDADRLTRNLDPGGVMGTADYVAPEQLIDSSAADHRADIYSLGATLYHLVAGKTPFEGSTTAKLVAHQLREAPPAHDVNPEVPEELSDVVTRMMAKKPDDRPESMAEVVQDLLPFVADAAGPGSSVRLPPLAAAAVGQTTGELQAYLSRQSGKLPAADASAEVPAVRRKKRLALAGLGAVVLGGVVVIAVAVAAFKTRDRSASQPPPDDDPRPSRGADAAPPAPQTLRRAFTLPNEKNGVEAAVFTPDGAYLVTCGGDKTVRVWDGPSGKPAKVHRLEAHTANVRALSLLPGGRRVLSASADKTVRMWNIETGELLKTFEGFTAPVTNVVALPNGRRFVSAANDGSIWLWDLDAGKVLKQYDKAPLPVFGLAVTRDAKRAVAATWDAKRNSAKPEELPKLTPVAVWVFNLETGKEERRQALPASASHVTLSPDSKRAAVGTADGIALWDIDSGRFLPYAGSAKRVTCATFTRDGRHVLSTGYDNSLSVWEAANGRLVQVEPGLPAQGYYVGTSPDGRRAAVVGANGGAAVFDLPAPVVTPTPDPTNPAPVAFLAGHTMALEDVLFTPDGRVVTASIDKSIRVWDPLTGEQLLQMNSPFAVRGLALLAGGRLVSVHGSDKAARIWELKPDQPARECPGLEKGAVSVAAPADGKWFLTCGDDGVVRQWDAETGAVQKRFEVKGVCRGLGVTPDGSRFVVTCDDKSARLWDVASGTEVRKLAISSVQWRVGMSADGRWAGFGNGTVVSLWNLDTGEGLALPAAGKQPDGVAFTRDGRGVLAGNTERMLVAWTLPGGQPAGRAVDHAAAVRGVAISPDGRLAATSSADGTAVVWRLPDHLTPR